MKIVDLPEGKNHEYLRPRGLRIIVEAETGVTPPEPDQYWAVCVTDSPVRNVHHGRCVTGSTGGDTSMESLFRLIEHCINVWRREFEESMLEVEEPNDMHAMIATPESMGARKSDET